MKEIGLLTASSIRNNLRLKIMIAVQIAVVLMCVVALVLAFCLLLIAPEMAAEVPNRPALEMYLGLIIFASSLIGLGINLNVFGFQTMTREKSRGNLVALLATPLKVRHIWLAKSLAVFLPGLVLGEALALISLLAVNYVYFVPRIGFLITPWMILSSFIALPAVYFGLSLLAHLIGLTGKPATGNVIVQVFLPVFASLMINLAVRHVLEAASWSFTLANLGLAAVIGVILLSLQARLTRERIVLSHWEPIGA
ncbi:MAG: putative synthase subunit [Chloroflexi bacterium]|nr:putative synthase subunit [Chloroflexota bacterium]